jgi:hypothetical protein
MAAEMQLENEREVLLRNPTSLLAQHRAAEAEENLRKAREELMQSRSDEMVAV